MKTREKIRFVFPTAPFVMSSDWSSGGRLVYSIPIFVFFVSGGTRDSFFSAIYAVQRLHTVRKEGRIMCRVERAYLAYQPNG